MSGDPKLFGYHLLHLDLRSVLIKPKLRLGMVMKQMLPSWHSESMGCFPSELLCSLLGLPVSLGKQTWQHALGISCPGFMVLFFQIQQWEHL